MSAKAGTFKSQLPERIFDYFVTVELQPQVIKGTPAARGPFAAALMLCLADVEQVVPIVIYRYPLRNTSEKDNTIASIAQFCFPVIEKEPKSKMEKCVFPTRARRDLTLPGKRFRSC